MINIVFVGGAGGVAFTVIIIIIISVKTYHQTKSEDQ